jgi:hypothetical protein
MGQSKYPIHRPEPDGHLYFGFKKKVESSNSNPKQGLKTQEAQNKRDVPQYHHVPYTTLILDPPFS